MYVCDKYLSHLCYKPNFVESLKCLVAHFLWISWVPLIHVFAFSMNCEMCSVEMGIKWHIQTTLKKKPCNPLKLAT